MKNKAAALIIFLLMVFCLLPRVVLAAQAGTGRDGDYSYRQLSDGTYEITGYFGSKTENMYIPGTFNSQNVTGIGENAFAGRTMAGVSIPGSVTYIESGAFKGCSRLSSITFRGKSALRTIGGGAFSGTALTGITFPDSLKSIGGSAFGNCASLSNIVLNKGLEIIESSAFSGDKSLLHITIPRNVKKIGDYAFSGCTGLTKVAVTSTKITFGDNVFDSASLMDGIYGFADSTVQKYASYIGISYHILYKVTFDSYGGPDVDWDCTECGDKVSKPEDPVRANYVFAGWYKEKTLDGEWNFDSDTITKDVTLYAKWLYKDKYGNYYAGNEYGQLKKFLDSLSTSDEGYTNGRLINNNYNSAYPSTFYGITWNYRTEGSFKVRHAAIIKWKDTDNCGGLNGNLDLSNFKYLEVIDAENTHIDSLKVISDTTLTTLECYGTHIVGLDGVTENTGITSIDLSTCTALQDLEVYQNWLSALDVRSNTALTTLNCRNNNIDKTLDLTRNAGLCSVICSNNRLGSLDTSAAGKNLTTLCCGNNIIGSLTINGNTDLSELECNDNQLTGALDLTGYSSLKKLDCCDNKLTSINLTRCTGLNAVNCYSNYLRGLSVNDCTALEYLYCGNNIITTLDISRNTALAILDCGGCGLSSLDLSANKSLYRLMCGNNSLSEKSLTGLSPDVQKNFIMFSCNGNMFTTLDASGFRYMQVLDCTGNPLKAIKASIPVFKKQGAYPVELTAGSGGYVGLYWNVFDNNEKLFAAAAPDTGAMFVKWTNKPGESISTKAKYSLVYGRQYDLTANFDNLGKPASPAATAAVYNKIKVSWDAVTGAKGYKVYRADSQAGKYTLIKTTEAVSFIDSGVTIGKDYYYKVAAYDKYYIGQTSDAVSAAAQLGQVTGVKASRVNSSNVKIAWKAVPGAVGYKVYVSTDNNSFTLLADVTNTYCIDLNAPKTAEGYYFKVIAHTAVGSAVYNGAESAVFHMTV